METVKKEPTIGERLLYQSIHRNDRSRTAYITAGLAEVRRLFESVRDEVKAAVAERREVEYVHIPARYPFVDGPRIPSNFNHRSHRDFLEFFEWGKANDLCLRIKRSWDTNDKGLSWYMVRYEFDNSPEIETPPEPEIVPETFRPPRPEPKTKTKAKKAKA